MQTQGGKETMLQELQNVGVGGGVSEEGVGRATAGKHEQRQTGISIYENSKEGEQRKVSEAYNRPGGRN